MTRPDYEWISYELRQVCVPIILLLCLATMLSGLAIFGADQGTKRPIDIRWENATSTSIGELPRAIDLKGAKGLPTLSRGQLHLIEPTTMLNPDYTVTNVATGKSTLVSPVVDIYSIEWKDAPSGARKGGSSTEIDEEGNLVMSLPYYDRDDARLGVLVVDLLNGGAGTFYGAEDIPAWLDHIDGKQYRVSRKNHLSLTVVDGRLFYMRTPASNIVDLFDPRTGDVKTVDLDDPSSVIRDLR